MVREVIMPKVGLTMQTGIIERWLKKEGDYIKKGEPIFEISTDKTNVEVEATEAGHMKKIVASEGQEIPVNEVIAYIDDNDEELAIQQEGEVKKIEPESEAKSLEDSAIKPTDISISPLAKKLAEELGIDVTKVKGSGPRGRILKEDILSAKEAIGKVSEKSAEQQKETEAIEKEQEDLGLIIKVAQIFKLEGIKKLVADRMKESYLNAPHICLSLSCDMSKIVQVREIENRRFEEKAHLTYTDIIIKAAAQALKSNPLLNSTLRGDSIIVFDEVNIGIATKTKKGFLVVPVIKNADRMSLFEISVARENLVGRTREGKHTLDDITGGTFTITNLGMFGIESFDPIITPGQAAILSVGTIKMTPVVDDSGQICVKPVAGMSVTCDHRIADGADAARFLSDLKEIMENPKSML